MRPVVVIAVAAGCAALPLFSGPASATATRTFVSGVGSDANPCTLAAPCRSFAQALTQTSAGGEITILDPAGYGAVTITKSVSIVNDGVGEAGVTASSGSGITVSTGASDVVNLRGLTLVGASGSSEGILFTGTGTLNIQNCVIRGFGGDGIGMLPGGSATFNITDTIVSNVGNNAVVIQSAGSGTVTGVWNRVQTIGSGSGFLVNGANSTGAVDVTIANGLASNNGAGVSTEGSPANANTQVMVVNSVVANNGTGIFEDGGNSTTYLEKTTIAGNTIAINVTNSGALFSFGDNYVKGNGNDGGAISLVATK
jgi:hypothetical protein